MTEDKRLDYIRKWSGWFESLSWRQQYLFPVLKIFFVIILSILLPIVVSFSNRSYIIISILFVCACIILCLKILNSYFDHQYYFPYFYDVYNQLQKINEILDSKEKLGDLSIDDLYYIATICYELDRYTQAEKYFMELIKRHPEHDWSHIGLARCYSKRKQYNLAKGMYEKALEIEPNNKIAREELSFVGNIKN